jgi:selenophosphate synthase
MPRATQAVVSTVDFPGGRRPCAGQIAAANALSDIYMGARPLFA